MYEEGSTPIQVAIALDLREKEVSELYREWWNLNRLYQLNQVYEDNDFWSIAELNRRRKVEQTKLEVNNKYAATTFQQFTDSI